MALKGIHLKSVVIQFLFLSSGYWSERYSFFATSLILHLIRPGLNPSVWHYLSDMTLHQVIYVLSFDSTKLYDCASLSLWIIAISLHSGSCFSTDFQFLLNQFWCMILKGNCNTKTSWFQLKGHSKSSKMRPKSFKSAKLFLRYSTLNIKI